MGELARIFFDVLTPVFVIVGLGVLTGSRLQIDTRSLSTLAYWVLGPIFMFDALANADLAAAVIVRLSVACLAGALVAGLATFAVVSMFRRPQPVMGGVVTTSVFGNTGNFGLAISAFALGEEALPLAAVAMVVLNTMGIVIGVAFATGQRTGPWPALRTALLAPMALATPPAILVNVTQTTLPIWLDRSLGLAAGALIPVMLLTLGMQLARMGLPRLSGDVVLAVGSKLLVAPAMAALAVMVVGLGGIPADVVILQSAMPTAVFASVISIQYDLVPDQVTTIVLAGTLASVVTLPVIISLL